MYLDEDENVTKHNLHGTNLKASKNKKKHSIKTSKKKKPDESVILNANNNMVAIKNKIHNSEIQEILTMPSNNNASQKKDLNL